MKLEQNQVQSLVIIDILDAELQENRYTAKISALFLFFQTKLQCSKRQSIFLFYCRPIQRTANRKSEEFSVYDKVAENIPIILLGADYFHLRGMDTPDTCRRSIFVKNVLSPLSFCPPGKKLYTQGSKIFAFKADPFSRGTWYAKHKMRSQKLTLCERWEKFYQVYLLATCVLFSPPDV